MGLTARAAEERAPARCRFKKGDLVRVKAENAAVRWRKPHLRTPGYIYGLVGEVERDCQVRFRFSGDNYMYSFENGQDSNCFTNFVGNCSALGSPRGLCCYLIHTRCGGAYQGSTTSEADMQQWQEST